ncbi:hypothetical protein ACFL6M_06530, partial [Candidatus Eisenbacteria bacterium]
VGNVETAPATADASTIVEVNLPGGVSVSINPPLTCVGYGQEFDVYIWVDVAGSGFDSYQAVIGFDSTAVEYVSAQPDTLIYNLCHSEWWQDSETDTATVFISHAAMCGGDTLTGPGALASITFRARWQTAPSEITFDLVRFFNAGLLVDVITHDGHVEVVADTLECVGACCLSGETCQAITEVECQSLSGEFLGYGVSCDPNPCTGQGIVLDEPRPNNTTVLWGPRPNPLSSGTMLRYQAPQGRVVRLEICDVLGRRVRQLAEGVATGAAQTFPWDGRNDQGVRVDSGVYLCRLAVDSVVKCQRVVVLR